MSPSDADGGAGGGVCRLRDEKYRSWEWTWGKTPAFTYEKSGSFCGAPIRVAYQAKRGIVSDAVIDCTAIDGALAAQLLNGARLDPEGFARWKELALAKGFCHVASAPLARSSYKAWEALEDVHDLYWLYGCVLQLRVRILLHLGKASAGNGVPFPAHHAHTDGLPRRSAAERVRLSIEGRVKEQSHFYETA